MTWVFGGALLGALALLMVTEAVRFRRARGDAEALPYPARRLARRLVLALLLMASLGMALCWPAPGAGLRVHALWLGGLALLFLTSGMLWLKDLHETSRAAVDFARRHGPEA